MHVKNIYLTAVKKAITKKTHKKNNIIESNPKMTNKDYTFIN